MRGSIGVGAIIVIIAILGITAVGAGYVMYEKNASDIKVNSDGVSMRTDGVDVIVREDEVNVAIDGFNASVGDDDINVNMDGVVDAEIKDENIAINNGAGSAQEMGEGINTVLIFDASGSMATQVDGDSRINIAKDAVAKYVSGLEKDVNLSVVAYGHKGDNTQAGKATSCAGIEEIYYMGPVDGDVINTKVKSLKPNGWTPITDSLKKAQDILNQNSTLGPKHILLLSDGEETCGGDPIAYAKQLCDAGIVVDVIGLDVSGFVQTQLNNISVGGCGKYYGVKSASDFSAVVNDMGVKLNTGNLNLEVNENGVSIQGDNGLNLEAGDNGASVKLDGVDIKATNDGASVDVSGVVIPSF